MTGPSVSLNPSSPASRVWSCSQIRSSDQVVASSVGSHWKYIRWTRSVRWLISANPPAERV